MHHGHYSAKVRRRLEERGMVSLLQPGLTRATINAYRLGHILDALFAANLNRIFGAIALQAIDCVLVFRRITVVKHRILHQCVKGAWP